MTKLNATDKLTEARARWVAAEFNYAKNPIYVKRVRLEKAKADYEKLKAKLEA